MSRTAEPRARPISPHLTVYFFSITMWMSIVHRITGIALYAGTALVAWWLLASAGGPRGFGIMSDLFGSWLGLLALFGYTWALLHHMLGGIRHLIWDTGHGLERNNASKLAWATLIGSVALTVLVWAAAFFLRS
jgi:succinate dehydrogenase / fumarate reductase cytochrome b subunit